MNILAVLYVCVQNAIYRRIVCKYFDTLSLFLTLRLEEREQGATVTSKFLHTIFVSHFYFDLNHRFWLTERVFF